MVKRDWFSNEETKGSWPRGDFQSLKTNTSHTLGPLPNQQIQLVKIKIKNYMKT